MNKLGKVMSVYWFVVLFIVASGTVYMASAFYGTPYDAREVESRILTTQIANCIAEGGYLKDGVLTLDFQENFFDRCNLNLQVEDIYGWRENGQYYIEVAVNKFDESSYNGFGDLVYSVDEGNINLKTAMLLQEEKRGGNSRNVDTVVIHYTETVTKEGALEEFARNPDKSIHYLIDRDGYVAKGVDENEWASHAGNLAVNKKSIGIELVNLGNQCVKFASCSDDDGIMLNEILWEKYPEEQIDVLVDLVSDIVSRYEIPIDREHIIGHADVEGTIKVDPGDAFYWDEFMARIQINPEVNPETEKGFYVLDKETGDAYIVNVLAIVGKESKNK